MTQVSFSKVSVTFGDRAVLAEASFSLPAGSRVGLVGENGSGKTTILRLIAGELRPDGGAIDVGPGRLAWVRQCPDDEPDGTAVGAVLECRPELAAMHHRLAELEGRDGSDDAERYAELVAQYSEAGGYRLEGEAQRCLSALGLGPEIQGLPMQKLSGGERARAMLARALLSEPQLLLLDEPDAHLDVAGLEWLEEQLRRYGGTLVLVSHDRDLLEACTASVLEIEDGRASLEHGALSGYLERKQQRLAAQASAYEQQQRRVELLRRDIRRTQQRAQRFEQRSKNDHWRRIGKKIAQTAKARQRRLERELAGARRIERPRQRSRIGLRLDDPARRSDHLLLAEGVTKSFGARRLLSGIELALRPGQRLAITGPNGCGKTTLLEVLLGLQECDSGEVWLSPGAEWFYCDQHHAGLDPRLSAFEVLSGATELTPNQVYYLLARQKLRDRAAHKLVRVLSGGERTRLVLALLMNARANLLVLDEPTSHLDLPSIEVLEGALRDYAGAVLLVTHDRRFIRAVATDVLTFTADGKLSQGAEA